MNNKKKIILISVTSIAVITLGLGLGLGLGLKNESEKIESKYKALFHTRGEYPVAFYYLSPNDDNNNIKYLKFANRLLEAKFLINEIYSFSIDHRYDEVLFHPIDYDKLIEHIKRYSVKRAVLIGKAVDNYWGDIQTHNEFLEKLHVDVGNDVDLIKTDDDNWKDTIYSHIENWVKEK